MGKTTNDLKNRMKALRTHRENSKQVLVDNSKYQQVLDLQSKIKNCQFDLAGAFKGNYGIQCKLDNLINLKAKLEKEIENDRNNTGTNKV